MFRDKHIESFKLKNRYIIGYVTIIFRPYIKVKLVYTLSEINENHLIAYITFLQLSSHF